MRRIPSVDRSKVQKPLRKNGKAFKPGHEVRNPRKADYNNGTLERIGHSLPRLPKESLVEVYAIALDLLRGTRKPLPKEFTECAENIVRSAARSSLLNCQLDTWTPGIQIKKDDYERFIDYHDQCRVRLVASLTAEELMKQTGSRWIWYNARCGVCRSTSEGYVAPTTVLGTGKYLTTWWVTYLERTVTCVGDSPCERAFESDHIWKSIMRALAKECPTCHQTAVREFPLFKKRLLRMVTKIVDSVCTLFFDRPLDQKANCV